MAKRTNSAQLKGVLDIDWSLGELIVTEETKEGTHEYSLGKLLEEFNGKTITISVKEEDTITPIDEVDFNVSSENDGSEEEDFFKED